MENEEQPPNPPAPGGGPLPKMIWLFVAFLPAMFAVGIMSAKSAGSWAGSIFTILEFLAPISAAMMLTRGMKNGGGCLMAFLIGFFMVINLVIVVFVGCSGSGGRIAP